MTNHPDSDSTLDAIRRHGSIGYHTADLLLARKIDDLQQQVERIVIREIFTVVLLIALAIVVGMR